ncbi:MAG: histidine kinase [Dysgonomonas sp.]|nr:histidine kinase [Dysgonomonas sp.]
MKESYILPSFLVDSKYRFLRHFLFILTGAIITFNQTFVAYQDCQDILGSRIYLICLSSFLLYLITIYFNYYYLVSKFLLKGEYVIYFVILSLIVFSLPVLAIVEEYWVRNALQLPHRITSYTSPLILIDSVASFVMTLICFCGVTAFKLFNYWIAGNKRVSELEYEHLKSKLNKLKGQVTPAFLSKTLRNASSLVMSEPQRATDMLMRLGQLLRYQLYDCSRQRVFLKSEINFLTNFLDLERLNRKQFQYRFHTGENLNNISVSPLLFISLIQDIVDESLSLDLFFHVERGLLTFMCQSDGKGNLSGKSLSLINKRLELQYPQKHRLLLKPGIIELQINISENGNVD